MVLKTRHSCVEIAKKHGIIMAVYTAANLLKPIPTPEKIYILG